MLLEALEIGRKELAVLKVGDVSEAERLAHQRESRLASAVAGLERDSLQSLADELVELKQLQVVIVGEARELRERIRVNLIDMRKQTKRISGYSRGAGNTGRYAVERFVNKKG